MAKSHPVTIDLSSMIQVARNLVFTARRQNQLESLTVKSVRTQVIRDFGLDETISEREDIKVALRNAVHGAVSEELPTVTKPVEKRKRAIGGADDTEHSVSQRDSKQKVVGKEGRSRKKSRVVPKTRKVISSDADDTDSGSSFKAKPASTPAAKPSVRYGPPGRQTEVKFTPAPVAEAEKSESELSVLINESPKKPVKKKAKGEKRTVSRESKSAKDKEPSQVLDEDETTIKRLKSFVTACGVRKVWSKEFADLPLAKHQIKHLKEVLTDIGMTGKYSMEKAKAIKAKRELARELDDVLEFERKAGVSRSGRRQITKAKRSVGELDTESEVEEGSEDEASSNILAAKRKNTASRSIMAYLATQSSGED
ncbi:hypothetical protein JB92DRAFT_2897536 [Gautieria morchelliformis]|nr:hypothetical protein JB92DRAFT_2897536 [Gautieria morchelliformis]